MPLRNLLVLLLLLCCRLNSPAAGISVYKAVNENQRDHLAKPLSAELLCEETCQLQCCIKVRVTPCTSYFISFNWLQIQATFELDDDAKPITASNSQRLHKLLFPFHSFS